MIDDEFEFVKVFIAYAYVLIWNWGLDVRPVPEPKTISKVRAKSIHGTTTIQLLCSRSEL